MSILSVLKLMR